MATQGPNSAATITGGTWTNPTNAAVTDAVYATATIPALTSSNSLTFSAYGFSIPAGAVINGIQVDIVRHASVSGSLDFSGAQLGIGVNITKVAGTSAAQKTSALSWGAVDATQSFGSGSDLWGIAWSVADVNGSGFGVTLQVDNNNGVSSRTASIDSVLITVTYTPLASTNTQGLNVIF